ncbi:hypothetical protein OIU76_020361 [Salix suchowensis]|nr:hypothetical protein OIU76_020361 [Salix suchowensis]
MIFSERLWLDKHERLCCLSQTDASVLENAIGNKKNGFQIGNVLFGSEIHVIVSGSPRLNFHETEFGWGRPKKMEDDSDDKKTRAISLVESRDDKCGIEEAG